MPSSKSESLGNFFLASCERFPERTALVVQGQQLTYADLHRRAAALAATLHRHCPKGGPPLTAVFAYRSPSAFVGVLGALLSGRGYVPMHRTMPIGRNRHVLQMTGCRAVIVDREAEPMLPDLLSSAAEPVLVLTPDRTSGGDLQQSLRPHVVLGEAEFEVPRAASFPAPQPEDLAYLLFTSGSTGNPKGVMVAHRNVVPLVQFMVQRYRIDQHDRTSQTFDMTFDLSVHDMFVTWAGGACLHCPSQKSLFRPDRFIRDAGLTIWYSVPSLAALLRRMALLRPGCFPDLRVSLFCGEPLPVDLARAWQDAAPRSVVDNLYGPTELTISCMHYRWAPESSPAESHIGILPIGWPNPGMDALVVSDGLQPVAPGEEGELLMRGAQVTPGYWQDSGMTARAYVIPPGHQGVFYRTGDRVRRPREGEPMTFLGRVDHQVKVQGHRVELGEVETAIREETGLDEVVVLGWPLSDRGAEALEAFVCGRGIDLLALRRRLGQRLPTYMVPRGLHLLASFPKNSNGKTDRKALFQRLANGVEGGRA